MAVQQQPALRVGASRVVMCGGDSESAHRLRDTLSESGHELVGTWDGLLELIEELPRLDADVVVVAVDSPRDVAQLAFLRPQLQPTPVVAIVPSLRGTQAVRLISAEIDGLIVAREIEHAIVPAIASVLGDQLCLPMAARPLLAGPVFSHREKQVLRLLLAGLTNSEIASQLYLSESTVKSHLSSSFRKLGVSSRAEVLRRARNTDASLGLPFSPDRSAAAGPPVMA